MLKSLRILIFILSVLSPVFFYAQGDCVAYFDLAGNDTLCQTSEPLFLNTGLPEGGYYSGVNVSGNYFNPSGLASGQYELYYTAGDLICNATDTVVMTILDPLPLTFVGDMFLCDGQSTTISSPNGEIYRWESGNQSNNEFYNPTSNITSSATGPDANGCPSSGTFSIEVGGTLPENVDVQSAYAICAGAPVILNVGNALSWEWFNGSSEPTLEVTSYADATYGLHVFGTGSCDTLVMIGLTIFPSPTISAEADTIVCYGDYSTIYGSGADSYKTQFGPFASQVDVLITEDITYEVVGLIGGCRDTVYLNFHVLPLPEVTFSLDIDTLCAGDTAYAAISGAQDYSWFNADSGEQIFTELPDQAQLIPFVSTNYYAEATSDIGCTTIVDFSIFANPLPPLAIAADTAFCYGLSITLTATGSDSLLWSTGSSDPIYEFTAIEDFELELFGVTQEGCSDSLTFPVVVHPIPLVDVIGNPFLCEGDTSILTASGGDTYTYNGIPGPETFGVNPSADSVITVWGITEFGCIAVDEIYIDVQEVPTIEITGQDTICFGDGALLNVESNGFVTWSDELGDFVRTVYPQSDSTFTVLATALNGCTSTALFSVSVNPLPVMNVVGENEICFGETTTLLASGAVNYIWSNDSVGASLLVSPPISTHYRVTGTSDKGCKSDFLYLLTVNPTPYAFFEFNVDTICDLGPVLSWIANPSGGVLSGDGVANNWFYPGDALVGLNTVTYTITNEFNCSANAVDSIVIDNCSEVEEDAMNRFTVYPNPTAGQIKINTNGQVIQDLAILDMSGKMLERRKLFRSSELNIHELPSGIYYLNVTFQNGSSETVKLVKL